MELNTILNRLHEHANPDNVAGMARFGISSNNTLGVSMPVLHKLGKEIGKDHVLASELWATRIHEARILASLVDDSNQVTERQLEHWVRDFDSWDVCDQCCINLFAKTPLAYLKPAEWSNRPEEFVKRAGFALIATLAVHDKKAPNANFIAFLPLIARESVDERNFVKKAVNWALRQIGKRNATLREAAIQTACQIQSLDSKSARWIASDALRELM